MKALFLPMLRFQLFGFPILIQWMFWLNTALLGGAIGASTPAEMRALGAAIRRCSRRDVFEDNWWRWVQRR